VADLGAIVERLVRAIVGDTTYYKQYPSTVQAQNGMTLDLLPDDEKIRGPGGLSGVPLRVGLPGFEVRVPVGARVLLGFDEGNPAKPNASLFDPNSVTSIHYADGTQAIARQGDLVVCGGTGLVATFSTPAGPIGAPPNNAMVPGVPYLVSFSPVLPTPLSADPLYGSIATGRPEFTA
jgi:hypothetical protein